MIPLLWYSEHVSRLTEYESLLKHALWQFGCKFIIQIIFKEFYPCYFIIWSWLFSNKKFITFLHPCLVENLGLLWFAVAHSTIRHMLRYLSTVFSICLIVQQEVTRVAHLAILRESRLVPLGTFEVKSSVCMNEVKENADSSKISR